MNEQLSIVTKAYNTNIIVTINLTKAETAYNSSGSDFNNWLWNTLLLTFN